MKLLIATPSPFARKARIALLEKGIPFEVVIENPWLPASRVGAENPLGKIPVLTTDAGEVIHDSRVIVEYLETLDREPCLVPAAPRERIRAKQIEAIADGVCDAVVLIVLEHARPPERQSTDWLERQRAKVRAGVIALAAALADRTWFVGDRFGLADIAAGCMLGYLDLRLPDFAWRTEAPPLCAFFDRVSMRPSFVQTVPVAQTIGTVR